ncbi:MAG TPA: hypothetical protein VE546_26925 [Streptomyces sp.]|uniref:hypothetical protein n=1 Tax=Streptomyces sp. TaxID=1931 RepID=UPI002D515DDE|nr:hypothetical protein [Streptomyces sp.]HZG07159.1 hypothetical protein [Streptomyces sp.]
MTKFLLSVHVLAAIIAIGPVTVAASMFPAAVRRAAPAGPDAASLASVRLLHRICRVYAGIGLAVPVFGLATASSLGVLTDAWLIASMVLTAAAAGVLALLVLPGQEALLARLDRPGAAVERDATVRLAMLTGVFNLLWAVVTVLMIVRPGSTTGV